MTNNGVSGPDGAGVFGRRLLLAIDAKGYGGAGTVTQRQFQEAIARLVGEASDAARLDQERWATQEGGDSLFAVLPDRASEPALVDTFMRTLDARLRAFNRDRKPQTWLRLRAAVHFGPASVGANGFVGPAPVEIGRILDCAALRAALVRVPDACLAVGVSATVFHDVVKGAHTTLRGDEFRRVPVEEKEYRGEAWIWVPGDGVRRPEPEPDAERPTPGDGPAAGRSGADGEGRAVAEPARRPEVVSKFTQHVASGGTGSQSENATLNITQNAGTVGGGQ